MVLVVLFRRCKQQYEQLLCCCQASFTGVGRLSCHGIILIGNRLIGVIDWRNSNWLFVMIRDLVLGCLALVKNAIESGTIAIEEPLHV
jgi:hypothetical protein